MPANAELIAFCLQPIAGDSPAGADLRYDTRLDAIKEARREENLPGSERKTADWNAVVASTSQLLAKETKDLQLGAWLTEALLKRQSFAGLATGLGIIQGLLDQYWDTVYPLPEDDDLELRLGPLEWVATKLTIPVRLAPTLGRFSLEEIEAAQGIPNEEQASEDDDKRARRTAAIEAGKPTPEDITAAVDTATKVSVRAGLADLAECQTAIASLEKASDARFGSDGPSFSALRTALELPQRYLQVLLGQKLEIDPDPIEEISEAEGAGALVPDGPQTPEPVSAADAAARVAMVAKWLRQQDSTNPAPYLMVRGFRWGELRAQAPELNPRLLEAPPTATRARLKGFLLDGKWVELLEQGEVLMATPSGRGWLDLQRYLLTACSHLPGHDAVAAAVRSELRALLAALPQLSRMTLMDDTPTANEETREWLEQEGLAPQPESDETSSADDEALDVEPSDGSDVLAEALDADADTAQLGGFKRQRVTRRAVAGRDPFELARAELAQNRPHRAIEILMESLSRDQSPRGRFVRQTQIAYVMVEAGMDAVANPILMRLAETIEERALEQWEAGPLVAQPLALLCRVLERTGGDEGMRDDLYLRVCRLDPMQAIALKR